MTHDFRSASLLSDLRDAAIVEELELSCRNDAPATRPAPAWRARVGVTVRPANVVDREAVSASAHTIELRRQGTVCIASRPVMVGNIFHLTFDRTGVHLAPALALCERCTLLSDSSFELRFKFVQDIDLPHTLHPGE